MQGATDLSNPEEAYENTAEALAADFVKQRPLYINLLDDLGSTDFFVIDGDGLLLECLASPSIDLDHGGQMLHLIYIFEDFIHKMEGCLNARFGFVFFTEHAHIWQAQEDGFLSLARHTIQQHLRLTLQQKVLTCTSWDSQQWCSYVRKVRHSKLSEHWQLNVTTACSHGDVSHVSHGNLEVYLCLQEQPAFLLMSDASTAGQRVIPEQYRSKVTQLMQAFAIYSLSIRLPVALMADVRFQQVRTCSSTPVSAQP